MKKDIDTSAGIVRRIDELGRIVIPKEIRKVLRIRDGEPLEISVDNEKILLKKFSHIDSYKDLAKTLADEISKVLDKSVLITNRDKFITCSGDLKKEFANQSISKHLEKIIKERNPQIKKRMQEVELIEGVKNTYSYCISPIIAEGNIIGLVIICSNKNLVNDTDEKFSITCAQFLEKYIEE